MGVLRRDALGIRLGGSTLGCVMGWRGVEGVMRVLGPFGEGLGVSARKVVG